MQRISKYIKLVEIVVVQIFGSLEDERCFNTLSIIQKKFRNQLTTHLDVVIQMFVQKFSTFEFFPYDRTFEEWKVAHSQYVIDV